ncbi:MAG TPA: hypothetical protein VI386_35165 [Candidatus Sulfotelmatobacter sp.]
MPKRAAGSPHAHHCERIASYYNRSMHFSAALAVAFLAPVFAQNAVPPATEPTSVTVPMTIDDSRIVIDVSLPLPGGSTSTVRGWVDNGDPDLSLSQRAAKLMGLTVTCDAKTCSAKPPSEIFIGSLRISQRAIPQVKIPLKPENAASVMAAGMSAEINLPSSVLRKYDVLVNFPGREFSIGIPGSLRFQGSKSQILVNPENGLIQIPSKLENKKCNLGLDLGSSISFLSEQWFDKLSGAHSDWKL